MIWNYPIPTLCYVIGGALALFALYPKYLTALLRSRIFWGSLAVAFLAGMVLLTSNNFLMGDGLTHLNNQGRVISATEPLEVFVHYLMYLLVGDPVLGYRIVAFIAGLFYLFGIYLMTRVVESVLEKGIIAFAFLCTATIQFYFGYVEHYTLANLFILYYLYFAWRDIRTEGHSLTPLLFFALAFLSHFSAIVLLPSLFYLYCPHLQKKLFLVAIPVVAAGVAAAIAVNIWIIFVPFWKTDFSSYTFFSGSHLLDMLRTLLLVSPGFFLVFWKAPCNRTMKFAAIALAGALLFTLLVDPKIGAFRDWDLLSVFAVPLAMLISLRAPRHHLTVVILMVLFTTRIIPWLFFNSQPQEAFIKAAVLDDPHYSSQYDKGQRLVSWGQLLYKMGDWKGAEEAWLKKLEYTPDNLNTVTMLAPLEFKMGNFQEAYYAYQLLNQLQPDNPVTIYHLAYVAFRVGDYESANKYIASAPTGFDANPNTIRLKAGISGAMGNHHEAVEQIRNLPESNQDFSDSYLPYVLAKSALAEKDVDLAGRLVKQALALDPANQTIQQLDQDISHH